MDYICVTLYINNIILMDSFYKLTDEQSKIVFDWYYNFLKMKQTVEITPNLFINTENFFIERINETENPLNFEISKGNTSNILEYILDLDDFMFESIPNTKTNYEDSDSDSKLYTETENISLLIDAHIKKDKENITKLLNNINNNDNIVNYIRNNN